MRMLGDSFVLEAMEDSSKRRREAQKGKEATEDSQEIESEETLECTLAQNRYIVPP